MKLCSIFILVICLALNVLSRKLCGTSNCRQGPTLSLQCSDFLSFSSCKSSACDWFSEENRCLPQSCDGKQHKECIYNFNCKWNLSDKVCVERKVIFKRR